MMDDRREAFIGVRLFSYGVRKPVFLDVNGKQYLFRDDGAKAYGYWLNPKKCEPDECILVTRKPE